MATKIFKCKLCGNIVEVLINGGGELVCCGAPMEQMQEKTADTGKEKHVPVIEKTADGVKVKVGSVAHPMEAAHFIQWVELIADGAVYRKFLSPGQAPEAFFKVTGAEMSAREYCNIHGLWRS